jgi:hypothetical protein
MLELEDGTQIKLYSRNGPIINTTPPYLKDEELNTDGFRCKEFKDIIWENCYAMVGCSHVFGTGNYIDDTIPKILEKITAIECINLGVPGTGYQHHFFTAMRLLMHTKVPKVIMILSYPYRGMNWSSKGVIRDDTALRDAIKEHNMRPVERLIKFLFQSISGFEHYEIMNNEYIAILKNIFADRIILLDISQIEKEFGGVSSGKKAIDYALDNNHYGSKWNYEVANKIKLILNTSNYEDEIIKNWPNIIATKEERGWWFQY